MLLSSLYLLMSKIFFKSLGWADVTRHQSRVKRLKCWREKKKRMKKKMENKKDEKKRTQ